MSLNNISFILHKPQLSENIGACARGMKNFNFNKLTVINPKPVFPNDKILATSVGAKNIINKAKNFESLEKSLKNIYIVIATSARFINKNIKHIQLEDLTENLKELNLSLVVSKKAKRLLSKNGFSLEYGVRFLRREIQNSIENPLSELLLAGKQFKDVAGVKIDVRNNMFIFEPINFKRKKITNKKQIPTS